MWLAFTTVWRGRTHVNSQLPLKHSPNCIWSLSAWPSATFRWRHEQRQEHVMLCWLRLWGIGGRWCSGMWESLVPLHGICIVTVDIRRQCKRPPPPLVISCSVLHNSLNLNANGYDEEELVCTGYIFFLLNIRRVFWGRISTNLPEFNVRVTGRVCVCESVIVLKIYCLYYIRAVICLNSLIMLSDGLAYELSWK